MDESCNLDLLKDCMHPQWVFGRRKPYFELSVHTSNRFWMVRLFFPIQFLFISHTLVLYSASSLLSHIIYEIPPTWSSSPTPVKGSWWDSSIHLPVGPCKVSHIGERPCYPIAEGGRAPSKWRAAVLAFSAHCGVLALTQLHGFTDDWAVVDNKSSHRVSAGAIMWQIT